MLSMAGIAAGQTVLDVAAGAGDQTLDIAARVGPSGAVVATDISETILSHALRNARQAGYATVSAVTADAAELDFDAARFDAAVCRLGLMFLPDPLAGLCEIYRVLKPGARFCAMVFAGPEANPCLQILMQTALRHAGLAPRDPFLPGGLVSLGIPGLTDDLLRNAGFRAVATTRMDAPFRLPSTKDYLAFVQDAAGPVLHILGQLEPGTRAADAGAAAMSERAMVNESLFICVSPVVANPPGTGQRRPSGPPCSPVSRACMQARGAEPFNLVNWNHAKH